jgi:Family of unknown function (DUF6627)
MRSPQYFKPISRILILTMLHLCWLTSYGYAEMIPTESVNQVQNDRQRLLDLLDRQEVIDELEKYSISKVEAVARINSLTNEEVAALATKIDRLPEGGEPYGEAAILAVFIAFYIVGVLLKGMVCLVTIFSDYCESKGGVGWVFRPFWSEDPKVLSIEEKEKQKEIEKEKEKIKMEKDKCYSDCYSIYYSCINPDQQGHVNESICEEASQTCFQQCEVEHSRSIEAMPDSAPVIEEDCDPGMESCT